jgi:hypothetical protein
MIPLLAAALLTAYAFQDGSGGSQSGTTDWSTVAQAVGMNGTMLPGGIFTISLPRDDIRVSIGDVELASEMGVDSWMSFMDMGNESAMMADLVLTPSELRVVQKEVLGEGLKITAIHTTLAGEKPQVFDLHVEGTGDPAMMARAILNATRSAGITYTSSPHEPRPQPWVGMEETSRILGVEGKADGGIVHYVIPRAGKVTAEGMEMPPYWDVSTQLKFQPLAGNSTAVTGEFVLTADEVEPAIRALNDNDITVTALHSHMLTEEPRLFYVHFWAVGDHVKLARGLREAIDRTNSTKGASSGGMPTHGM